jgi:hypothetical protein
VETETKSDHVFRHWYENRQIVIFEAQEFSRQSMDTFADWVIETVTLWDHSKPLLIGYNLSKISVLTPHMIQRSMEIYHAIPTKEIIGRTAIITARTRFGMFVTNFAERMMKVQNPNMLRKFFTDQQKALEWLSTELILLKPKMEMPELTPALPPAPQPPLESPSENPPTP